MTGRLRAGYIRPTVKKTIVKGTIAVAIFSLFMKITPSNINAYLMFLVIWYSFLVLYILWKKSYKYQFNGNSITFITPLKSFTVSLENVDNSFVSQGPLAKRFYCGSVYLILGKDVKRIWDVSFPQEMEQEIRRYIGKR